MEAQPLEGDANATTCNGTTFTQSFDAPAPPERARPKVWCAQSKDALLSRTFSFLEYDDMIAASRVCQRWKRCARADEVWEQTKLDKICESNRSARKLLEVVRAAGPAAVRMFRGDGVAIHEVVFEAMVPCRKEDETDKLLAQATIASVLEALVSKADATRERDRPDSTEKGGSHDQGMPRAVRQHTVWRCLGFDIVRLGYFAAEATTAFGPFETGTKVWPAAFHLARLIGRWPTLVCSRRVLELGCGTGLCALASLQVGARVVVATDASFRCRLLAKANVALNLPLHLAHRAAFAPLRYGEENKAGPLGEQTFCQRFPGRFDVILGSDIVYASKVVEPIFSTVHALLADDGVFVLAHTDRDPEADALIHAEAKRRGFHCLEMPRCSYLTRTELQRLSGPILSVASCLVASASGRRTPPPGHLERTALGSAQPASGHVYCFRRSGV